MPFPVDSKFIREAERALGAQFPPAYVAFLENANGAMSPDDRWEMYPVLDTTDRKSIRRTANHLVQETNRSRRLPFFPSSGVVIGEGLEGHLLVLLPDPEAPPCLADIVYGWYPNGGELKTLSPSITTLDGNY